MSDKTDPHQRIFADEIHLKKRKNEMPTNGGGGVAAADIPKSIR